MTKVLDERARRREELRLCRERPTRFNRTVLHRPPYWSRQSEICESIVRNRTTAVKTGNGVGKSYLAAGILLWFAVCYPGSRSVVAAPTLGQLANVVWAELKKAMLSAARAGRSLGGKFDGLTLTFGDGWSIEGFGGGSVESKAGRHAGDLLAVIDEASGVHPHVLEAIDSLNPSKYLYLGNPLRPEGKFYEVCELSADNPYVNVVTIPSTESPDIHLDRSLRGLADRTWLETNRLEYGEDSLWWPPHVLAMFPGELSQGLLPIAWLNLAAQMIHARSGSVRLGVDISKGVERDQSMIVGRDDTGIVGAEWSNRWSLEELAKRVRLKCEEWSVEPAHITYDATGIGTDFDNRLRAVGIAGAKGYLGAGSGGPKYANLRSACGWAFRRRLDPARSTKVDAEARTGGRLQWQKPALPLPGAVHVPQRPFSIPAHVLNTFRRELQGCRYGLNDAGAIALEPKDDFIKRLKFSPNFLDATMMTFAFPNA